jgi:tetratricopeptide (TPR) repeat protein
LSGDWEYGLLSPDEAFPKAKAAATKALALDDDLAEAHTSLAFVLDLYDWNWELAEKEYKRALALNPSYATAHHWYAWHLIVMGRNSEALAESRKAESLDPLSPIISADLATRCASRTFVKNRCSKVGKHFKCTHTFPLHITNSVRPSRKSTCMMKQLPNFGEQSSFPEAIPPSNPNSLMFTPLQDGPMRR